MGTDPSKQGLSRGQIGTDGSHMSRGKNLHSSTNANLSLCAPPIACMPMVYHSMWMYSCNLLQ